VLSKALEADLAGVVVCGYDKDGDYYFASSVASGSRALWLLRQCEKRLLEEDTNMGGEPGTDGA